MDKYTSTLLPYILDLLSRQPELRIPMDDIIKHIQDAVMFEHVRPFGSLRNAVDVAIGVGETTGVLTLIDEEVTPKARKLTKKRTPKTRSRSARTRKATTCRHLGKNKRGRVAKAPKRR